jgi:hypothetical protein
LNGQEIARAGVEGGGATKVTEVKSHEAEGYEYFPIKKPQQAFRAGDNILAIEGHNAAKDSSDFSLDPYLVFSRKKQDSGAAGK